MSAEALPHRYGKDGREIMPTCRTCKRTKKPIGRDAPPEAYYCDSDCDGYMREPLASQYWSWDEEEDA